MKKSIHQDKKYNDPRMPVQDNEENQKLKRRREPGPTHRGERTYVAMYHINQ